MRTSSPAPSPLLLLVMERPEVFDFAAQRLSVALIVHLDFLGLIPDLLSDDQKTISSRKCRRFDLGIEPTRKRDRELGLD